MASFLTALASIGAQRAQGQLEAREEGEARKERQQRLGFEQSYLDIARQAEERQRKLTEQGLATGDLIKVGDRLWSVSKAKFVDMGQVNPMDSLKEFIGTLPPDARARAANIAKLETESNPNDLKAPTRAVLDFWNAYQAEANRREDAATRAAERQEEQAEGRRFREHEASENRKFREQQSEEMRQFQRQMVDFRLNEKSKFMTPQERQQWESIKTVEPMVNRLSAFIEKSGLQNENDYIFGNHSALMQHLRMRGYKFGTAQEPQTQELIKDAAAISIMGAAPWVRIGRGKYTLEQIQQHLPKPTDTPANLYDKTTWLRDNVLLDAKESLAGMVPPGGGTVGEPSAPSADNPLGLNLPQP